MTPILLYDNVIVNATITESSYYDDAFKADNLKDNKNYSFWKSRASESHFLLIDLGSSEFVGAISIVGHNLYDIDGRVTIYKSDNNTDWEVVVPEFWAEDSTILKIISTEITEPYILRENGLDFLKRENGDYIKREGAEQYSARYWKFEFTTERDALQIAGIYMGGYIQFEYPPETPTVPVQEKIVANSTFSNAGYMLGIDVRYFPKEANYNFRNFSRGFATRYKYFWKKHGRYFKPFIFAWDYENRPNEIFLCSLNNNSVRQEPLSLLPYVDELNVNLKILE